MISYIVDKDGNKTHVIIPMEEWKENHSAMSKDRIKEKFVLEAPVIEDLCPNKHLENLLPLIEGMELLDVEDWQKEYKDFFKYMEGLKYKDIYLLYLIRNKEFIYNLTHCDNEDSLDLFQVYYGIKKLSGGDLTLHDCKELRKALYTLDDNDFLKYFNSKYKLNNIKDKKIRIDAEINRLFIYDLVERFPECMTPEYEITPKEAQTKLMKFLYNNSSGAKTQVQRALRQVSSYMT
jgi:hypothetical protein